jgi:iron complex transport system substrate-binding protein
MISAQRIDSFLPSATEMARALGLSDRLVGLTHECDYPPDVKAKPAIIRPVLPIETIAQPEIAASERLQSGQNEANERLLRETTPDPTLTENLCQLRAVRKRGFPRS